MLTIGVLRRSEHKLSNAMARVLNAHTLRTKIWEHQFTYQIDFQSPRPIGKWVIILHRELHIEKPMGTRYYILQCEKHKLYLTTDDIQNVDTFASHIKALMDKQSNNPF